MNWEEACRTLGVPTTANQDEIHAQYMYKVQLLHPDKNVGLPERARKQAEEELKLVNVAYSFLRDVRNNTTAIAPKLRVSPKSIRFGDMAPGQSKSTQIHIESVGGTYTKFWMGDPPESWLRIIEVKSVSNDPLPLDVTIEATGVGTPKERRTFSLPIRLENEKNKTKDETALTIEMIESDREVISEESPSTTESKRHFTLSNRSKLLALLLVPAAIGLLIFAYVKSLIPFWMLLAFSITFVVDKWFKSPIHKHHPLGILYRVLLNVGLLGFLGFGIWTATKLFSGHFMSSSLIGSLVFMSECVFFVWLGIMVGRNSWRRPSMKLTIAVLVATFLIFAFAGVEPMATYKNNFLSHFNNTTTQYPQP
jgi:curved DNA-binding protein CbpA